MLQYQIFPLYEMTGYEEKTTCWNDFCIAEHFGEDAIKETYSRMFEDLKCDTELITELTMVLNWKMWQQSDEGNISLCRLYEKFWRKNDEWCMKNLKEENLSYYLKTID